MKKIINIFQGISITIGFLAIILFLIPKIIGIEPFIVLSGSMEDEIKTGSVAYINTHIKAEEIKEGDIIAFKIPDGQVTHRVVKINEDGTFTTKGDANETEDVSPVKIENYKGKTIFSIPYLGKILNWFNTRMGKFIVFTIIGLNILCILFEGNGKEKKQKSEVENNEKAEKNKAENMS